MTRKEDLEGHIRDSYNLILEYEEILRTSDRPKEKARARRNIEEQWELVEEYLDEYLSLCQRMGSPIASDIREIAVRFENATEERVLPKDEEPPSRTEQGAKYSIQIDHAEGLAIGNGARVEAPRVDIVGDGNVVGDGSSSHMVKGSTPPAAAGAGGWNTVAIQALLTAAFSDGELTTLCFDHFHAVYETFGTGMTKGQKIQLLLDHCVRQQELENLLERVKERNPAQYARFASRLER